MPAIGAAIGALWTAFTASSVFSFLTTSFLGKLLVSVAASALLRALAPKPRQPGIKTTQTLTGGVNPTGFILGRYATAGTFVAPPMSHGVEHKTPLAYLTYVIDLGDVPGQTLERVMINDTYVTLGTEPHPDYGLPVLGEFEGYAWIRYRDGSQTAADPMLLAKYGDDPERPWSADMIGRGVPHAIATFRFNRELFNAPPRLRFEVGGIPLYDPRSDSSVGGAGPQRWGQPATWTGSLNPFVQIYNVMRGIALPDGTVWGGGFDADALDLASFIAAMNECDRGADGLSGVQEPQFRSGLEVTLDEEPADVIGELLKACSGQVVEAGGVWKAQAGAPALPVWFFGDGDIVISEPEDAQPFPGLDSSYNGIHASFPDPEHLWEPRDAPPRYNAAYEAEDQGRRLIADLNLPAVPFGAQVQRLMHAYIEEERRFRRHGLTLPPDAALFEPLDVIAWTSATNGYVAKAFEIHEITDDLQSCLQRVSLQERDPEDYSWPEGLVLPLPAVSGATAVPAAQGVPGWSVHAIVLPDATGTARRPALELVWEGEGQDDVRGVHWQVRIGDTDAPVGEDVAGDVVRSSHIVAAGILPATRYEARARFVVDRPVLWSPWLSATTADVRLGAADLVTSIVDDIAAAEAAAAAARARADENLGTAQAAIAAAEATAAAALADLQSGAIAAYGPLDLPTPLASTVGALDAALSQSIGDIARIERTLTLSEPREVRADAQLEALARDLMRLSLSLSGARSDMAEAGFHTDPATGRARIEAVSRIEGRLGEVSVALDAALAQIALRATYTDVNRVVSDAVLDPTQIPIVQELEGRVSDAEVTLSGLEGAVTARVTTAEFAGATARLTAAELALDSLDAELSLRVTRSAFDALGAEVADVQVTLGALDGASFGIALSDIAQLREGGEQGALATLGQALAAWEAGQDRLADLAWLREDMQAVVSTDRQAVAQATAQLGAAIDGSLALIETTRRAQADAAQAVAQDLNALQVRMTGAETGVAGNAGALGDTTVRVAQTEAGLAATAVRLDGVDAGIAGLQAGQGAQAAATSELSSRVGETETGLSGQAGRVDVVSVRFDAAGEAMSLADLRAALERFEGGQRVGVALADARSDLSAAISEQRVASAVARQELTAAIDGAVALVDGERTARAGADAALAALSDTLRADLGQAQAGLLSEASARAAGDQAQATRSDSLEVRLADAESAQAGTAAALQTVTARVGTVEGGMSSQAQSLTTLSGTVGTLSDALDGVTGALAGKASVAALSGVQTEVSRIDGRIDGQASAIDDLRTDIDGLDAGLTGATQARQVLDTRLTAAEGTITGYGQRIDTLEVDIGAAEGALSGQATALGGLTVRMGTVEGGIAGLTQDVTGLNASIDVVADDTATAQAAAAAAAALAGGKGKVIVGPAPAPVADRLPQNLWIDTTNGANTPRRWTGTNWAAVTDKVASDAANAAAQALAQVATRASASALSDLTTRVSSVEGVTTTQAGQITALGSSIGTVAGDTAAARAAADAAAALAGGKGKVMVQSATPAPADRLPQNLWIDTTNGANAPKRWTGSAWAAVTDKVASDAAAAAAAALAQVATKASADALGALTTRVTDTEGDITALASAQAALSAAVNDPATGLPATRAALTQLDTTLSDAQAALASRTSTLEADTAATDATVAVQAGAIAGLQGNASASYALRLGAGGPRRGWRSWRPTTR